MTQYYNSISEPGTMARFYNEPKANPFKTKQARIKNPDAAVVYDPQIMVDIRVKGVSEIMRRPMQEVDKRRFSVAWQAFEGADVEVAQGTPLSKLPGVDDVTISHLENKGINSLEDLAALSEAVITQLGRGYVALQLEAKNYLKDTNDTVRNSDLQIRLEKLEHAVAEINRKLGAGANKKPKLKLKENASDAA